MDVRNYPLPEILNLVDSSKLNYVDGWAFATSKENINNSICVYFVAKDKSNFNLTYHGKWFSIFSHVSLNVSKEYFLKNEKYFKAGIKETAKKLADDGMFEKALSVIPTSIYVFDKNYMDNFAIHYEMALRRSKLSEDRKKHFKNLRFDLLEKHIQNLSKYDLIKSGSGNGWKDKKINISQHKQKIFN